MLFELIEAASLGDDGVVQFVGSLRFGGKGFGKAESTRSFPFLVLIKTPDSSLQSPRSASTKLHILSLPV